MPPDQAVLDATLAAADMQAGEGAPTERTTGPRMTYKLASQVEIVHPVFLWDRWLVRGALHLLIGRQGFGKSTFAAFVAARVNAGIPLHGDTTFSPPATVAMLSLEEPDDRVTARLAAAGADLDTCIILGDVADVDDEGRSYRRPWRLPVDCGVLEALIVQHNISLVTVDGLGYSVGGDSHNYANVGSALSAFAGVAERTGCAILGLTHPPKGGSDAVTAAIGSTAWTSVPRICWVLGLDPEDETGSRRVVNVAKTNFQLPESGLAFTIADDPDNACGYVSAVTSSDVTADSITAAPESEDDRSESAEVADFLMALTASGPVAVDEARQALKSAGYDVPERSLRRARARAGLVVIPPAHFGGKRSFGRPDHAVVQSGQHSPASSSSSQLAGQRPHDATRENVPSPASPATPQGVAALVAAPDDEAHQ